MTETDELAAFLAARLDEDERYLNSNRHHLWTERPLRENEAKRRILADHHGDPTEYGAHRPDGTWQRGGLACMMCGYDDGYAGVAWPCSTVRAIAAVYSDHPDDREEWEPPPTPSPLTHPSLETP